MSGEPKPPVECYVGDLESVDLGTVDLLARLRLAALRMGHGMALRDTPQPLKDLLTFTGLDDVLPDLRSALEPQREPEQREHALHVEEEDDVGDLRA